MFKPTTEQELRRSVIKSQHPWIDVPLEFYHGWDGLLTEWAHEVEAELKILNIPLNTLRVWQIKEKLGSLRLRARCEDNTGNEILLKLMLKYQYHSARVCEYCSKHKGAGRSIGDYILNPCECHVSNP